MTPPDEQKRSVLRKRRVRLVLRFFWGAVFLSVAVFVGLTYLFRETHTVAFRNVLHEAIKVEVEILDLDVNRVRLETLDEMELVKPGESRTGSYHLSFMNPDVCQRLIARGLQTHRIQRFPCAPSGPHTVDALGSED